MLMASGRLNRLCGRQYTSKVLFDITTNPGCTNNLQRYIDMSDDDESFGRVLDETQFLEFCKYST